MEKWWLFDKGIGLETPHIHTIAALNTTSYMFSVGKIRLFKKMHETNQHTNLNWVQES